MKLLIKSIKILVAITAITILCACSKLTAHTKLRIIASSTPHAEILQYIVDNKLIQNDLEISITNGIVDANDLVNNASVEVNFFQHTPYLNSWTKQHPNSDLIALAKVHIEPIALYSRHYQNFNDIPANSTIAIPKDVTNFARALYLFESIGLIQLKQDFNEVDLTQVTTDDIISNPKKLQFIGVDATLLPRTLSDKNIAAAVINTAVALLANLNPIKDGLAMEQIKNNPFVNILVAKKSHQHDQRIQQLVQAITSQQVQQWLNSKYAGAVLPAAL